MVAGRHRVFTLLALALILIGMGQLQESVYADSVAANAYSLEVSYAGTGSGVVEVSYGEATPGTTVELVATPDKFSHFVEWQASSESIVLSSNTEPEISFEMPAEDLQITAVFDLVLYDITVFTEYGDGGPRDAREGQAAFTAIVTANLEPLPGFLFKGWEVQKGDALLSDTESFETSFPMPAESVEIVAYFEPILFLDIEQHELFAEMHQASWEGWLDGYLEEELHPDRGIDRAEFCNLLTLAFKLVAPEGAEPCAFTDITEHPYAGAIETLAALQLVSGTSPTEFSPDLPLTREQAVAILVRACAYLNIPEVEPMQTEELTFSDIAEVSDWALTVVERGVKLRLDSGRADNTFAPLEQVTRAEAIAQIVHALGLGRTRTAR